jgi:hypothetical protein
MSEKIGKVWREWRQEALIILGGIICANLIFISRAFRHRQPSTLRRPGSSDPSSEGMWDRCSRFSVLSFYSAL